MSSALLISIFDAIKTKNSKYDCIGNFFWSADFLKEWKQAVLLFT